ncbi:hypothetical protein D3C85_978490 [compost metagenome]
MHHQQTPGLAHRGQDALHVQRLDGGKIQHLALDILFRQQGGGSHHLLDAGPPRDHGEIPSGSQGETHIQRQANAVIHHVRLHGAIDAIRFEEHHGIRIANGREQQAICPPRAGGDDHPQARNMGKQRLHTLAVVLRRMNPSTVGGAVDDGAGEPAAGAVSHSCRLADDLLHAGEDEALELEFGNGFEPLGRHADRHPGDQSLRQRRVDHPLEAELVAQAHGGAKHPAVDSHIFTQHHHIGVVFHLMVQCQIDRFEQCHVTHGVSPRRAAACPWR